MDELQLREDIVRFSRSLFERGFSVGTAGNISVALPDGYLMTPTNSSLGSLEAERISKLDKEWNHVSGDKPSKEVFLHRALYESRKQAGAIVHLHSTYATALSCLKDTDPDDCLLPLTPYAVMRVGTVKMVPYVNPGCEKSAELIRALKGDYAAVLLENHGPVVSAKDLASAVYASEELEETAKLLVLLRGAEVKLLPAAVVAELKARFKDM